MYLKFNFIYNFNIKIECISLYKCDGTSYIWYSVNSEWLLNILSGVEKWQNMINSIENIKICDCCFSDKENNLESEIKRKFRKIKNINCSF